MAAALPSFSDKTSARSGDKHKPRRGTEEEATQITTATIQGFGGAAGSHGHCLALVSYFVLLLKVFLGCGWHFSEQRLGEKNTSNVSAKFSVFCFCVYSKTLFSFFFSKGKEGSRETEREGVSEQERKDERVTGKTQRGYREVEGRDEWREERTDSQELCFTLLWCGHITPRWHYDTSFALVCLCADKARPNTLFQRRKSKIYGLQMATECEVWSIFQQVVSTMRLLCTNGAVETHLFWVHVQTLFAGERQGLIIEFLKNKHTLIETQTSAGLLIFSAVYISIVR